MVYLLLDEFTTADAAPLTSPRTCEPGPGTLTAAQVDGSLAVASGALDVTAQATPAWGDLGLYGAAVTRSSGVALVASISVATWEELGLGWHTAGAVADPDAMEHALQLHATDGRLDMRGDIALTAGLSTATPYKLAVILLSTGAVMAIYDGAAWRLLFVSSTGATATLYPALASLDAVASLAQLAILDLTDPRNANPAGTDWSDPYSLAIVHDTFTDTNDVNLTAHTPETGGPWTIWGNGSAAASIQSNAAVTTTTTALVRVDAGTADVVVIATVSGTLLANNNHQLYFRMTDEQLLLNCWYYRISASGNVRIYEVVNDVHTLRGSTTVTVATGGSMIVRCSGSDIRGFYRSPAGVYTALTAYTSTVHQAETRHGFQIGSPATLDGFTVYPINITNSLPEGL